MHRKPDDFEALRRLLTIKRHEVAPPGYFHRFADKVIARIEAQELRAATFSWRRWFADLLVRPLVSGAALLVAVFAIGSWALVQTQFVGPEARSTAASGSPAAIHPFAMRPAIQPVAHAAILPSSVSPVVGALDSPFRYYGLRTETVAFEAR